MRSRRYELKETALTLRKRGLSIGRIERRLRIPRSTLSGWFKDIELTAEQKKKLLTNWKKGLIKARKKAVLWQKAQKEKRLQEAENAAIKVLENIDTTNQNVLEVALALLYLGEGTKKSKETALGNSNLLILRFFLTIIRKVYKIDTKKIRCELYLRADQNPGKIKKFWSNALKLPLDNFRQVSVDKRTRGTKTYPYYKGVCNIRCSNVAIQRKLIYLGNLFCQKVIEKNTGS